MFHHCFWVHPAWFETQECGGMHLALYQLAGTVVGISEQGLSEWTKCTRALAVAPRILLLVSLPAQWLLLPPTRQQMVLLKVMQQQLG